MNPFELPDDKQAEGKNPLVGELNRVLDELDVLIRQAAPITQLGWNQDWYAIRTKLQVATAGRVFSSLREYAESIVLLPDEILFKVLEDLFQCMRRQFDPKAYHIAHDIQVLIQELSNISYFSWPIRGDSYRQPGE